jgi:hypothetical protein
MAKITVTVPRHGISSGKSKVQFDVDGVKGQACTGLTIPFSQALGNNATQELKPEFYEQAEQHEHLRRDDY